MLVELKGNPLGGFLQPQHVGYPLSDSIKEIEILKDYLYLIYKEGSDYLLFLMVTPVQQNNN